MDILLEASDRYLMYQYDKNYHIQIDAGLLYTINTQRITMAFDIKHCKAI
jgi:hypothetical protein